ncbi:putative aminomethyltransferase protein [Phaeoacremonium minimum UCRPA7]|uniref:Putative aminomethyltransferase protein n=1 Tax=Phaeoacremonium minimum (strain UCR-PA7) TaxID=1286976 RepID=R8B8H3_PHAM7|nr:putative aminomethyltransferase protein [Phaeoacremonium minimum UCRPA7]EON95609.1 putative aminomethyltransferase protein [Phaeoacremonium minimum UCRPA7]
MENLPATAKTHIVPAATGYAFEVKKGERFRIVDIHGLQIVDFMAWVHEPGLKEHVRMSYTRFRYMGVSPDIGEFLVTNLDAPALKIMADTCKVHDMTFMSCFPEIYAERDKPGHRSCTMNITEAMTPYGITSRLELPDPFNIFQNSPNYTLKPLGCSRPGDYIEFEALKDMVCGLSCCPWEEDGMNGGKATDIAVITGL